MSSSVLHFLVALNTSQMAPLSLQDANRVRRECANCTLALYHSKLHYPLRTFSLPPAGSLPGILAWWPLFSFGIFMVTVALGSPVFSVQHAP